MSSPSVAGYTLTLVGVIPVLRFSAPHISILYIDKVGRLHVFEMLRDTLVIPFEEEADVQG